MDPTGIVYTSPTQLTTWLPLEKVDVRVLIVDVSCKVTLFQTYNNPLDTLTGRCKYMFPVPAGAAVCAFGMKTSDDRIVEGVAKDKEIAQREYENAIHARRLTGLVNYATDDIFTISVGSIPAHTSVKVFLEYVMNLANDDNADEIRFQLSSGVGQRYGTPPDELTSALRPTEQTGIKITCDIQMAGRIRGISSPSHDILETRYQTSGRLSRRRTLIKYKSRSFLDRDFVLIISAKDLDSPRCFAELQGFGSQTTLALQMSLVPKNFRPIDNREYLFVVDRSGSMSGARIGTAKATLMLLLRMLPVSGTIFNVYIFDNNVESWSPHGLEYNEITLREASAYVDRICARGGTELHKAVQHVLQARNQDIPTTIFLLTDGEVYADDAVQTVREAVGQASKIAPLCVFTLGIGEQVSTATCEGIATAGNGVCLYTTHAESIIGKCARLFRAARTPILRDVTIDWGIPNDHPRTHGVTFSGQTLSPRTISASLPLVQQAPTRVDNVHSGTQTIVSAIIQLRENSVPKTVYLHGRLDNDDNPFQPLPIPVQIVHLDGAKRGLPMIHTLTAWRLIQEHEGKRAELPSTLMPASEDDIRKAVIISLGEKYQLVSRYTSFVAIDSGRDDRRCSHRQATPRVSPRQRTPGATPRHIGKRSSFRFLKTMLDLVLGFFHQARDPPVIDARTLPGSWSTSSFPYRDETGDDDDAENDTGVESHETFSTLSSLNSCDCSDGSLLSSPELRPRLSPEEEEIQRQPSPKPTLDTDQPLPQRAQSAQPVALSPVVVELVCLQHFDGSYSLDSLREISGIGSAVDEVNNLDIDAKVWATALVIAFMQKEMVDHRALHNDLVVKSCQFLQDTANVELDELLKRAAQLLATLGSR
ncbi:hypothetical protein H2248_000409 [Termitomyces sp. 'cryptogamus']|nr:hypothetical protein H2248_000409 [Termitomyces sp. 'cryptogamus']